MEVLDINKKSFIDTFDVEIVADGTNSAPTRVAGPFADIVGDRTPTDASDDATERMKVGETRKVIDNALFSAYFGAGGPADNSDFLRNDELTLSVKYFPLDIGADESAQQTAAIDPDTKVLDPDKVGVRHTLSPTTWNGDTGAKFTFSLIGTKGTPVGTDADSSGHLVALIATDKYGESIAHILRVRVNNPPKAEGDQANANPKGTPKTLMAETAYQNITVPATEAVTDTVPLVVAGGGYFSDADGPADLADGTVGSGAGCLIKGTGGTPGVADFVITEGSGVASLTITPKEIGTKTVTIACTDTFGQESPPDILTVRVTGKVTGSRQ